MNPRRKTRLILLRGFIFEKENRDDKSDQDYIILFHHYCARQ